MPSGHGIVKRAVDRNDSGLVRWPTQPCACSVRRPSKSDAPARDMPAPAEPSSLPDRWLAAAADDPATDRAILQLIDACRSGASINEAALLRAIVQHATELTAQGPSAAEAEPTGAGDAGVTA